MAETWSGINVFIMLYHNIHGKNVRIYVIIKHYHIA